MRPHSSKSHIRSVTSTGRVTIPADLRRQGNIGPGHLVRFSIDHGRIVINPIGEVDTVWNAGQSAILGEREDPAEDAYNA